jgi:hypothetical protein
MGRENLIRISDSELELLEKVRKEEFNTDSVPIGEAVEVSCENYLSKQ